MRFNDLVATVLAARADGDFARAILWRQCVDLLAQFGDAEGEAEREQVDAVIATLERIRPDVPALHKLAAISDLGGRLRSARLLRVLMADRMPVRTAALRAARLADPAWIPVIAEVGPVGRSILRRRDDLGAGAKAALAAFGRHDLSLTDGRSPADVADATEVSPPETVEPQPAGSQIRQIVDRIERFTSERKERSAASPAQPAGEALPAARFAFVTDAAGVITGGDGIEVAMIAGIELSSPGLDCTSGPDGQILGAFRRRGAVRDGGFVVASGPLAGRWLVSAQPFFDQRSGRFMGYRGSARRSGATDQAPRGSGALAGSSLSGDSMRQLIHELRTPLNGVMGFAELIEQQFLGPVSGGYRTLADDIVGEVRHLVEILDDLDLASRDLGSLPPGSGAAADAVGLLRDAIALFAPEGYGGGLILFDPAAPVRAAPLDMDAGLAERAIRHLVRTLVACATGEQLAAQMIVDDSHVHIRFGCPAVLAGLDETVLFDAGRDLPGHSDRMPALGVGFTLRLVRRIAQSVGGALKVEDGALVLILPRRKAGLADDVHRAP